MSFFRYARADQAGTPNPLAGAITHSVASGTSQAGNLLKTFVHLGFNEDLAGRIVWDGIFPFIAARQTPLNFRFAAPGGAAALYEPGSEPVLWWSKYADPRRGGKSASLLDRCGATNTCPKVFEAFGATEFWGLRMSPGLVGTDAAHDIPLPDNVRRYYMPGTNHGGGRGGFEVAQAANDRCALPQNPNPMAETTRALTAALVDWVVRGTPPPPSRYPTLASGDLVAPTRAATGFPSIPGLPFADQFVNAVLDYDFGTTFVYEDLSGVVAPSAAGDQARDSDARPARECRRQRDIGDSFDPSSGAARHLSWLEHPVRRLLQRPDLRLLGRLRAVRGHARRADEIRRPAVVDRGTVRDARRISLRREAGGWRARSRSLPPAG